MNMPLCQGTKPPNAWIGPCDELATCLGKHPAFTFTNAARIGSSMLPSSPTRKKVLKVKSVVLHLKATILKTSPTCLCTKEKTMTPINELTWASPVYSLDYPVQNRAAEFLNPVACSHSGSILSVLRGWILELRPWIHSESQTNCWKLVCWPRKKL